MPTIYVPIDENGFADRENMSITVPEGAWAPFNVGMNGLYKPQWDGEKWVEGATPQEIEALTPPPEPPQPTPQERIETLEDENALLALELMHANLRIEQMEQDQATLLLELVSKGVI